MEKNIKETTIIDDISIDYDERINRLKELFKSLKLKKELSSRKNDEIFNNMNECEKRIANNEILIRGINDSYILVAIIYIGITLLITLNMVIMPFFGMLCMILYSIPLIMGAVYGKTKKNYYKEITQYETLIEEYKKELKISNNYSSRIDSLLIDINQLAYGIAELQNATCINFEEIDKKIENVIESNNEIVIEPEKDIYEKKISLGKQKK